MSTGSLRIGRIDELVQDHSVNRRLERMQQRFAAENSASPDEGIPVSQRIASSGMVSLRTDSISGWLSVVRALNALAARGVRPQIVRSDVLLPQGASEAALRRITDALGRAAEQEGIAVSEVQVEVTSAVTRPFVLSQALGTEQYPGFRKMKRRPEAGAAVLIMGYCGLGGTVLLAQERREELSQHFPLRMVDKAGRRQESLRMTSAAQILSQSLIQTGCGAFHLVNASEGGVYAALWQLSAETGHGFEVSLPEIPILQETIEFTEFYRIHPYQMASDGCMLAVLEPGPDAGPGMPHGKAGVPAGEAQSAEEYAAHICGLLSRQGVPVRFIGVLTEESDRILVNGGERQSLNRPAPDALIPILG